MDLPKEFTLAEIAQVAGARVGSGGDTKVKRVSVSPLQAGEGDLALFFDPKLLPKLAECKASAVLIPEGTPCSLPHLVVARPQFAMQKMLMAIQPKRFIADGGVHPSAFVDPTAELAEGVSVGPNAVVGPKTKIGARTKVGAGALIGGGVKIGEDCILHQGAMVADYCRLGNRVILQQGASIGADGFGYVTERPSNMELRMAGSKEPMSDEPNPLIKIPQTGYVILEDDVEIGSNSCVDRATMGSTVIGAGTKVDDLVMIAHNNRFGRECIVVAMAAFAGSCTIGDRAIIAGQVGVKDHTRIGKDAIVQAQCGVMNDIPDEAVMVGSPAQPYGEFFRMTAVQQKLPEMRKSMRDMQKRIEQLEKVLLERQLVEPTKTQK
jgi:UDP-3-O-[3-hydroxymyristoyl] glucosamine N-acyltransferase